MAQRRARTSKRQVWTIPVALAITTFLGLFLALTGDGWIDRIACIGLATPIFLTASAIGKWRS